ncbi:restriction endonuclease subunit S, partial [Corynebacterium variabile]
MSIFLSVGTPLPHGWKRTQLRRLVDIRNGRDYKAVEVTEGGYPVYGSGGEFRRASKFLHDGESILFGRKGTIDRPLYVDGKFWTVDTMYYAVPFEHVCARFLYYFATTIPFNYYVTSTALPSVTQSDLAGHPIDLPPLDEQRAIADYLDRETQKIDELIAEQRELIETLENRRQATIEASVFALGVETVRIQRTEPWLPSLPATWKVKRLFAI